MECNRCELAATAQFVCLMGQGPIPCNIMLMGEAPSYRKDRDKPFQGEAGKVLDAALAACGVSRDSVYITNVVRCRPPDNRSPKTSEIDACMHWTTQEYGKVMPQYVLLMGVSAARLLGKGKMAVGDIRGRFYKGRFHTYMVTLHPGAVLRDPHKMPLLVKDMQKFFTRALGKDCIPASGGLNYHIVSSQEELEVFYTRLQASSRVAFDIETTGLSPFVPSAKVLTMGFGLEDEQWVVPIGHKESFLKDPKAFVPYMNELLKGKTIICHNGKFDALYCKVKLGLDVQVSHDTLIMSHLLDENIPHGLKYLAEVNFGAPNYDISTEEKTGEAPLAALGKYNAMDVYYTRKLYNKYIIYLKSDPQLHRFYKTVMMPAVRTFRDIEEVGVYIDSSRLSEVKLYLQSEVARLEKELEVYKKGVNWNSTKQLAEFLFSDLKLPVLDMTPKGSPATSESILLRLDHPAVKLILKYREMYKMLGTFIESWMSHSTHSRMHPSFKLHGTVTGRLSCTEPNLQQVPRNPKLRTLVTAPPGYTFVEADFSQVELRVAAMLSGDPLMRELFVTGEDIHTKTAELVSGRKLSEFEGFEQKEWRKKAKAVNFGFLYGMGPRKFQEYARDKYQVAFSIEESMAIRKKFFNLYSGLEPWYQRQQRLAEVNGFVRSPCGRLRHLPDIHSTDEYEKKQAVRQAINSPVQGFASDLTLMSVLDIHRLLPHVRIVGTVHDAILMEIPDAKLEETLPMIKQIMESPPTLKELGVALTVPIIVEISVGSWGGGKKWEKALGQNNTQDPTIHGQK